MRLVTGVLAALAAIALAAAPARAGDPTLIWRTVESANFEVHYPEPLGALARKVAIAAERAHATLSAAMRHAPREKTHIVLTDDTDSSNGFASVLPRNDIRLFATAPSDVSALNDHDDWLFGLVAHEYTHVLHLDAIAGLPDLYNRVFGKSWSPNQIQPRWIIEGIATYQEGKRTSGGRTRHALFDMNLRVATLKDYDLGLDQLTNNARVYPHGNAAYLYGAHFLKYVFDRFGDHHAAEMSWTYGSSPLPYGVNRSIERSTGVTFDALYGAWREFREARYGLQAEAIDRAGRVEGRRLTFTGEANILPRYTPDGRLLVWQRGDGYSEGQYRALPVGGHVGDARQFAVIERSGGFDFLDDGSMIVEQTHTHRNDYDFQDLVRWDRATGEIVRLTDGARATDPAVSPDGRQVAFSMNGESRRRLAVMDLRPGAPIRVVWEGGPNDQAFTPAWSPDGRTIAFSAWRQGGYRDILLHDLERGTVRELMRDRAQDTDPAFSPDGSLIYYASDRTGVYNVYAYDLASDELLQVTNVLGCALAPEPSPDGTRLAYQGYGEAGYEIYELAIDRARFVPAPAYVDDRPDPVELRDDEAIVSAPRPYRALDTLPPQRWTLELRQSTFGRTLSATTRGNDVAGHHAYDLAATASLDETNVNAGGSYGYRRLWPSFRVAGNRTAQRRGGFVIDGRSRPYVEETLSSTVSVGLPVLREPDGAATLSVDYDLDYVRPLDVEPGLPDDFDPSQTLPRVPAAERRAGVALRLSYSDTRGYTYTIGPQQGVELALSARLDHEALGSQRDALVLSYRASGYLHVPFATPATLALRLSGGLRATEEGGGGFSLGGIGPQDVVRSIIDNVRASGSGYLRGYPERALVGDQFHLLNAEWRQELVSFERGLSTLPLYLRRLHYAALVDVGGAWDDGFDARELRPAIGGALRLDFLLGYFLPGTLDVGYSRGLASDGQGESWLLLTTSF